MKSVARGLIRGGSKSWTGEAGGDDDAGARAPGAGPIGTAAVAPIRGVSGRTSVGHRPGRLQLRRRSLGPFPPRDGPQPRLPLGGGRPRRVQRRPPAALSGPGALEHPRPDPERTALRPRGAGRQPRRGRQGDLLLPRRPSIPCLFADALQIPAGRVSVRDPRVGQPPARPPRAGVRADRQRGVRRRSLLRRLRRVREARGGRHPHAGARVQSRTRRGADRRDAPGVVPEHLVVGAVAGSSGAARQGGRPRRPLASDAGRLRPALRRARPAGGLRQRDEHRSAVWRAGRRWLLQGRPGPVRRTRRHGRHQPSGGGHQGGRHLAPCGRRRERERLSPAAGAAGSRRSVRRVRLGRCEPAGRRRRVLRHGSPAAPVAG